MKRGYKQLYRGQYSSYSDQVSMMLQRCTQQPKMTKSRLLLRSTAGHVISTQQPSWRRIALSLGFFKNHLQLISLELNLFFVRTQTFTTASMNYFELQYSLVGHIEDNGRHSGTTWSKHTLTISWRLDEMQKVPSTIWTIVLHNTKEMTALSVVI